VQSSKDSEFVRRLSGLHKCVTFSCVTISATRFTALLFVASVACIDGETCYVLLRDHLSNTIYGAAFRRISGLHCEMYCVLLRGHFIQNDAMRWNQCVSITAHIDSSFYGVELYDIQHTESKAVDLTYAI
jgi:hypothetical protein